MGLMKFAIVLILSSALCISCKSQGQSDKLTFKESFEKVSRSLIEMENLMRKFPKTYMVNYFVDNDGFLYLNNQRIAPLAGAKDNRKVRNDMVFEKFSEQEIDLFFMHFEVLRANEITSCHEEKSIKRFVFSFHADRTAKGIILGKEFDTADAFFSKYYEVLDQREDLKLIKPRPLNSIK
jgi:hypothetical protein